ncbi:MAG TPA: hypothetical protein VF699_11240 [Caulobacteraceae bacterium]|jgi:hypothetical protein
MRVLSLPFLLCTALAASAVIAAPAASALLYERALMLEANKRCRLFTPAVSGALTTAALQARSAARRAGDAPTALDAVERRAASKARATPCTSPDLAVAAGRVRSAHEGLSRVARMEFPGGTAGWSADRTRSRNPRWRVVQKTRIGDEALSFGLASENAAPPRLFAVSSFERAPTLVRLSAGGRTFLAEDLRRAPEPLRNGDDALAFRFSPAAAEALEKLDPRETVRLEFVTLTRTGERSRSAEIEVGDFAAARAFVAAG